MAPSEPNLVTVAIYDSWPPTNSNTSAKADAGEDRLTLPRPIARSVEDRGVVRITPRAWGAQTNILRVNLCAGRLLMRSFAR